MVLSSLKSSQIAQSSTCLQYRTEMLRAAFVLLSVVYLYDAASIECQQCQKLTSGVEYLLIKQLGDQNQVKSDVKDFCAYVKATTPAELQACETVAKALREKVLEHFAQEFSPSNFCQQVKDCDDLSDYEDACDGLIKYVKKEFETPSFQGSTLRVFQGVCESLPDVKDLCNTWATDYTIEMLMSARKYTDETWICKDYLSLGKHNIAWEMFYDIFVNPIRQLPHIYKVMFQTLWDIMTGNWNNVRNHHLESNER